MLSQIYLVTSRADCKYHSIEDIVKIAIDSGITAIQLREKHVHTRDFLDIAEKIKKITENKAKLIINDRVDIALAIDANGLHIGNEDIPYNVARKLLGKDKIIGVSVDSINDIQNTNLLDCDYIGVSGVFHSITKSIQEPWGIEGLKKAKSISKHSIVAIGGVNLSNIKDVAKYCDSVAIVSAICSAHDPKDVINALTANYNLGKI